MAPAVLEKLNEEIASREEKARGLEEKASERREQIVGKSDVDVNSEEFKQAAEEMDTFFKDLDNENERLAVLREQRKTMSRTLGVPMDPGGERKEVNSDELAELVRQAQGKGGLPSALKSMGDAVTDSEEFKAIAPKLKGESIGQRNLLGKAMEAREFKDLISAAGVAPFKDPERMPFEPLLQRAIRILQLLQTVPVSTDAVKFAQMITATHNVKIVQDPTTAEAVGSGDPAVTAVQAGVKPQATYGWTTKTADIETLAHWVPIHRNALSDVPQLAGMIDTELRYGLLEMLEREIISGTGGTDHLTGILNTSGIIEHDATTDSHLVISIHKIITKIRLTYNEPNMVAMHPEDWEDIRLMRDASGGDVDTGGFLFGPPALRGEVTLWGLPVTATPAVPKGQPLVGDFSRAQLYLREGVSVLASDSHADFFIRNLNVLLAEMRAGFGVRRPAAFGTIEE